MRIEEDLQSFSLIYIIHFKYLMILLIATQCRILGVDKLNLINCKGNMWFYQNPHILSSIIRAKERTLIQL
jgi:hypothetical protein